MTPASKKRGHDADRDALSQPAPTPSTQTGLSGAEVNQMSHASNNETRTTRTTRASSETRSSSQAFRPIEQPMSTTSTPAMPPPPPPNLTSTQPQPKPSPPPSSHPTPSARSTTLLTKITHLESQIQTLTSELSTTHTQLNRKLNPQLPSPSTSTFPTTTAETHAKAESIVKHHIQLLHDYNEIKDIGLGLMGLIADARGVRLADVVGEFGVGERGKD